MTFARKESLTAEEKRFIELMQYINFGRIIGLIITRGKPSFNPPPRQVREIKFGGENGPRPEMSSSDFTMKTQVMELFEHFDRLADGTEVTIEVKYGLPFRMSVEETIQV